MFFAALNKNREVAEWLKAHAWKACIWQHIEGSNPFLSAKCNFQRKKGNPLGCLF